MAGDRIFWLALVLVAVVLGAGLALYARRRAGVSGANPFIAVMLAAAISSLGYGLQLASDELGAKIFWTGISYLGVVTLPPSAVILVIQYTGRGRRLTRRRWLWFYLVPTLSLILLWTNGQHELFFSELWVDTSWAFPLLEFSYGPWFWVQNIYAYLIGVIGLVLMGQFLLNAPRAYRAQALMLLMGGALPFVGSLLHVVGIVDTPLDPTPIILTFSGILIGYGLFRHHLFDLMPVARDRLVESVEDGVMVLDDRQRIVYLNPASERLLKRSGAEMIGSSMGEVLPAWSHLGEVDLLDRPGEMGRAKEEPVLVLGEGPEKRYLSVGISSLGDALGRPAGELVVLRDITERQQVEEASREHSRFLALLNEITRAALDATDLPGMAQILADRLGELIGADACHIALWDQELQRTVPLAAYGPDRGEYRLASPYPDEATLTESVLKAGRPLVVEDLRNSPYLSKRIAELGPIRSALALPLVAGGDKIGAALICFNELHVFSSEEVERGEQVAAAIALAMSKVQALEVAQSRWREAETLSRAAAALTEMLSLDEILARILEQLELVVPYDSASVQLLGDGYVEVVGSRGFPDPDAILGTRFPVPADNPNTVVIESASPHILADLPADRALSQEFEHGIIHSWLGVPLTVRGRVIGMLTLDSVQPDRFGPKEVRLVGSFAGQAAIAIDNSRLVAGLEAEVKARTADIKAEKDKVETILRSVGDAISLADREQRIQYVNYAYTAHTGYEVGEVVGKHVTAVGATVKTERERQSIQPTLAQGKIWRGEAIGRRKDGRSYEALLTVAPVVDSEGRLTGYVSSHQDISQMKELERARSRFLTNISHELRTPVTGISLYTQLLSKGQGAPENTGRYLQTLEAQAARLQVLVQDIIEMTELDSGRAVEKWEPIQWGSLIRDLIERYEDRAEAAGLTLMGHSPPADLPPVMGDQKRISQALRELVENAVNFSPAGGEVVVSVAAEEGWVTVTVKDTGVGVELDEQALIFDRLYRGRPTEAGDVPGTGLGLSMAQAIAEAHGGRIILESEPGLGSVFTLWLRAGQ